MILKVYKMNLQVDKDQEDAHGLPLGLSWADWTGGGTKNVLKNRLLFQICLISYSQILLDPRSSIWTYKSRVVRMQPNEYIKNAKWRAQAYTMESCYLNMYK